MLFKLRILLIFLFLLTLALVIFYLIGGKFLVTFLLPIFFILLLVIFAFPDKIMLELLGAREITQSDEDILHQILKRNAYILKVSLPSLYTYKDIVPNCITIGVSKNKASICIEDKLLSELEIEQLEAIIIHALASIKLKNLHYLTILSLLNFLILKKINFLRKILFKIKTPEKIINMLMMLFWFFTSPLLAASVNSKKGIKNIFQIDKLALKASGNSPALELALLKVSNMGQIGYPYHKLWTPIYFVDNIPNDGMFFAFKSLPSVDERYEKLRSYSIK